VGRGNQGTSGGRPNPPNHCFLNFLIIGFACRFFESDETAPLPNQSFDSVKALMTVIYPDQIDDLPF
jgi:hypothetical protein